MIRSCTEADIETVHAIINDAAEAYRGAIPPDCWHEPYMTRSALAAEIEAGVKFWGWDESRALLGIMGIQQVRDVTLIRHAYVKTSHRRRGIGAKLLDFLTGQTAGPLLVGTWAAAEWAIRFYQRHNFQLVSPVEKDRLLTTYWSIPDRQRETSVVLVLGSRMRSQTETPATGS
ncbi:MAG TPA: GNAT family N-acetyltransferase [Bryobacteraceae bacterium]|nr:GNAT family N-acetyltransferase [Bryobacteraceae bacterium]